MTTICSDQYDTLPSGIRQSATYTYEDGSGNMVEKTLSEALFEAVDQISTYEYTWKDSKFSQTAMMKYMTEFKGRILAVSQFILWNQIQSALILQRIYNDLLDRFKSKVALTEIDKICDCKAMKYIEYIQTKPEDKNNEKLVIYLGHDTTIMPFLAALKVFDGKWPPYASQITFVVSFKSKLERKIDFVVDLQIRSVGILFPNHI